VLFAERSTQIDCEEIRAALLSEAEKRELDSDSISTTLTFAVMARTSVTGPDGLQRWHVAVAQIGDSHAYLLRSGIWERVTKSVDDPSESASNLVDPLPKYFVARVWHLDVEPGDVLALTTDGMGNLIEDQPDFASAVALCWNQSAAPSPSVLLYNLDAAVKSYDDDRTFLAIRFGTES
jgi:serine/threonine protein phosphatase PrpC